jgi:predicted amidohydrolase
MKIAVIQFAPVFGDHEKSYEALLPLLKEARGSQLIVLPELANSGYNFSDRGEAYRLSEYPRNSEFVDHLTSFSRINGATIVTGFNERSKHDIFNTALVINKKGVVGKYRKIHLFMNEKDIFAPGNLQPELFEVSGVKCGALICFDWIFPEIWRRLALDGADLICHPSNLVLPGKAQQAIPVQAMMNKIYIATANRIGTERELTFTGNSIIADPDGEMIASASTDQAEVIFAEIDIAKSRNKMATPRNHVFDDRRPEFYGWGEK